jgi:asparagine synthase (glutamine-hydrolysing)
MCGISGIYSLEKSSDLLKSIAFNMSKSMAHRGPDDEGIWHDKGNNLALSHRRLSIIDTSDGGHQPMTSKCGRYTIVFNGEIYNHHFLRKKLQVDINAKWQGGSDTEVLLLAIASWGLKSALKQSEGMFALALWDSVEQKLFLARDRFGEKPLYYGDIGKDFVFGSELKALRLHPEFNNEVDRNSITSFLQYSYIPSPKSIYKNIYKLPPAHILSVNLKNGQKQKISYWSLDNNLQNEVFDRELLLSQLKLKLDSAISDQMLADVPVGAFLSGGIDSSLIVALMQEQSSKPIRTFSIGFSDSKYDESLYAREVSRHLGTKHSELIVSPKELLDVVPKLPVLYDEPFGDSSQVPTFLLSKLARDDVKVALSGDGGDEVFGGYNRHLWSQNIWGRMRKLPLWLRRYLGFILSLPNEQRWNQIYSLLEFIVPIRYRIRLPGEKMKKVAISLSALSIEDLYECLTSLWIDAEKIVINPDNSERNIIDIKGNSIAEKMMFLDLGIYLPGDILTKVDRAAMGVSLETRIPFLNHKVVEFAWNMPLEMKIYNGESKWALRRILENYIPSKLINRPKMGFGVPIDSWLRGPLLDWSKDLLSAELIKKDGYFDYGEIQKIYLEHQSGKYNHHHKLWNILMFQIWLHNKS